MELLSLELKSLFILLLHPMTYYSKEKSRKLYRTQLGSPQSALLMDLFEWNYNNTLVVRKMLNCFTIYMFWSNLFCNNVLQEPLFTGGRKRGGWEEGKILSSNLFNKEVSNQLLLMSSQQQHSMYPMQKENQVSDTEETKTFWLNTNSD